jgi:Mg-chelatase subunit ChlD
VEGFARDLARSLDPPTAILRPRPSASRGALNLRRALAEDERPFDAPAAESPQPRPSRVWAALVDLSQSMGSGRRADTPMYGARRLTLWLDRVAELARITFGVYGFDDQPEPIRIAPLDGAGVTADRSLIRRRIAGMAGAGGTRLGPALAAAIAALAANRAERKLLITLIDGALEDADAGDARALLATLPRHGIQLLPLYLGDDPEVIAANTALFGHVIACSSMNELTPLARTWLRAARC